MDSIKYNLLYMINLRDLPRHNLQALIHLNHKYKQIQSLLRMNKYLEEDNINIRNHFNVKYLINSKLKITFQYWIITLIYLNNINKNKIILMWNTLFIIQKNNNLTIIKLIV